MRNDEDPDNESITVFRIVPETEHYKHGGEWKVRKRHRVEKAIRRPHARSPLKWEFAAVFLDLSNADAYVKNQYALLNDEISEWKE